MRREKAYVINRRELVLQEVNNNRKVNVNELAEKFNVSPITIRRDLQYLEDNKMIVRFYGGAASKLEQNSNFENNKNYNETRFYIDLLARYTAKLVEDDDTIFINSSSTALNTIKYINKKNVTIITNNTKVMNLEKNDNINVILTGGEMRYPKEVLVGAYAIRNLQLVYAKKSFIGCSGISPDIGMMTENANEVNINKLMIEHTNIKTYIIADHTKISKSSSFVSCNINQITDLITDEKSSEEILQMFREKNIKIHLVRKSDFY